MKHDGVGHVTVPKWSSDDSDKEGWGMRVKQRKNYNMIKDNKRSKGQEGDYKDDNNESSD